MHAGAGCWQADWLQESIFSALTGLTAAWHLAHQDLDNTWHLAHQDRTNRPLIPITPCTTPPLVLVTGAQESTTSEKHNRAHRHQPPKQSPRSFQGFQQTTSFPSWLVIGVIRSKKWKNHKNCRIWPIWSWQGGGVFSFNLTIHCSRDEEKCPQGARLSLILTDVGFGTSSSFSSSNQFMLTFPYHFHRHVTIFYRLFLQSLVYPVWAKS